MGRCFPRHRWSLLLLFISEIFSSVVESSVEEVNCGVDDSFTFPTRVPVTGHIMYIKETIGHVLNKYTDTNVNEKFLNRLDWDSESGFFTLSHLRTDDSGLYTVESSRELKGRQEYQLEVYERVSAPQVINTTSSSPEFCSLLCSVRNVRGMKLSWYEDSVFLNHTNSSITSNITLNLHLEIKMTDNYKWRPLSCVAWNPVSDKKTVIDITHYCPTNTDMRRDNTKTVEITVSVVMVVLLVVAVIVMFVWLLKRKQNASHRETQDSSASEGLNEEIQYSEINHKHTQDNIREHASEEVCRLTTIYDQITSERTADGTE